MKLILLDGSCTKAVKRLRRWARYVDGVEIKVVSRFLDPQIAEIAQILEARGYSVTVVTSDCFLSDKLRGMGIDVVFIPSKYIERKSSRDLATHIIKLVFSYRRG